MTAPTEQSRFRRRPGWFAPSFRRLTQVLFWGAFVLVIGTYAVAGKGVRHIKIWLGDRNIREVIILPGKAPVVKEKPARKKSSG